MRRFVVGLVCLFVFASGVAAASSSGPLFGPDQPATRCEVVVMLHRAAGEPTAPPHSFVDDPPAWCDAALSWAESEGIVVGIGWGTLDPFP